MFCSSHYCRFINQSFSNRSQAGMNECKSRFEINKILIANRGEIGCRVVRTARKMGLQTTAVYSNMDRDSMLVYLADEAINLGDSPSADSYMNKNKLIDAAKRCHAQAIHPGYGFLSENPEFADLCRSNGLIFIGPPASAIKNMGIKSLAKQIMLDAGVPVVPGYHGNNQDDNFLLEQAIKIGFPIMIKAIKGGGGKGMRISTSEDNFIENLQSARRESLKSFGDDSVLIEKYLTQPRHVEVQVFADTLGNCVYLYERDCSVQRRHQKIIEEAPGPGIDDNIRIKLGEAAVKAAKAVNYVGAGTVEFIYDSQTSEFYFMEMNTRIQVEHPVTEMITGLDLVEWQIRVARGEPLPKTQDQIKLNGHCFEARIYAENPDDNFMPEAGQVHKMFLPQQSDHVRIESGLRNGDQVLIHYDPMISKLVVWASDRNQALIKLRSCLQEFNIIGLKTNVDFLLRIASHPQFVDGKVHTDFINQHRQSLQLNASSPKSCPQLVTVTAAIGMFIRDMNGANSNRDLIQDYHLQNDAFRLSGIMPCKKMYKINYMDNQMSVQVCQISDKQFAVSINGEMEHIYECEMDFNVDKMRITFDGITSTYRHMIKNDQIMVFASNNGSFNFQLHTNKHIIRADDSATNCDQLNGPILIAPMPGIVEKILVSKGDSVEQGTPLIIMMAMKMEHIIKANRKAIVDDVMCKAGESVQKGSKLVKLNPV